MKKIQTLFIVFMAATLCLIFAGCGSNSVVGNWEFYNIGNNLGYKAYSFSLYEDGRCVGSPISCPGGTEATKYTCEPDGTLIFTDQWGGQKTLLKTNDMNLAISDDDYYYISGDTMVIYTCTYKKK